MFQLVLISRCFSLSRHKIPNHSIKQAEKFKCFNIKKKKTWSPHIRSVQYANLELLAEKYCVRLKSSVWKLRHVGVGGPSRDSGRMTINQRKHLALSLENFMI